jgi:hypothetical protein
MLNLKDVTFLIPIRVDQKERVRNLNILIRYLRKHLDTNIIVGEAGQQEYNNGEIRKSLPKECRYFFIPETSAYFNRMRAINILIKEVETRVVVLQDTDVLLYSEQYLEAAQKVLSSEYGLVYPYDGNFYTIPERLIDTISKTLDINTIDKRHCSNMRPEGNSVGGILFWDLQKFIGIGACNERLVSWGFDDNEIYDRANKLDIKIYRCKRGLFHLYHKQSLNSLNGSHEHYKSNEKEWLKVKGMGKEQLSDYIRTWR